MTNPLLGFASGVGESVLTGAINKAFSDSSQREMMKRQHVYNKEQMALQYNYNQMAQKNAPLNIKEGLLAAGFSPALAAEGKFSPAAGVSSPGMPASAAHNYASEVRGISDLLGLAQVKLVQSQAAEVETENKIKENELERRESEDATHELNLSSLFEKKIADREAALEKAGFEPEDYEKDKLWSFYNDMLDVAGNTGSSKAYNDFVNLARNDINLGADVVEATLRYMISNRIIKDKDVLRKLSQRPSAEFDEILSEISRNYASAFASKSSGNAVYHNDLTSMLERGDNLGTGVFVGKEIADVLKSWSPFFLMRRFMPKAATTQRWQEQLSKVPKLKGVQGNSP